MLCWQSNSRRFKTDSQMAFVIVESRQLSEPQEMQRKYGNSSQKKPKKRKAVWG
jgi:hypothetical protein